MIKVKFKDYYSFTDSYEKTIEGNLPSGVSSVSASYDGGRGYVVVGDKTVLDDLSAGDYSLTEQGISISVDRGRFHCSGEDFEFKDLSAGNDFNVVLEQIE